MIRTLRSHGPSTAALALVLAVSLTGCGSSDSDDGDARPVTDAQADAGPVTGGSDTDGTDDGARPGDDIDDGDVVTDPAPSDPAPSDPEPSDPEPVDPEPSDPAPDEPEPSEPTATTVPAFAPSFESFDVVGTVPADAAALDGLSTPLPVQLSDDGARLLLRGTATDAEGRSTYRFLSYDVAADELDPLPFAPTPDAFPAFDADAGAIAWADACGASFQRLGEQSEPVPLGGGAFDDSSCAASQSVQLSDDGDTVLVQAFDRDSGASAPSIVGVASGSVIALVDVALRLDAPELAGLERDVRAPRLSADGRRVVAALVSSDGPLARGTVADYGVATVLIDARSGDARVIGRRDYRRFVCDRCDPLPVPGPVISGDGAFVFHQQAPGETTPGEPATEDTVLYRHEIATGEARIVWAGPVGASEVVASRDGSRAAVRAADDVEIVYVDADRRVSLRESLRFCRDGDEGCLFTGSRFVTDTALEMSGDGSALTVYLIPQRGGNASPQDRPELLHVDLDDGRVARVAPGEDSSFHALSDDGRTVALRSTDERGEEAVAVLRAADR